MHRLARILAPLLLGLLPLAGCSSYSAEYRYHPRPTQRVRLAEGGPRMARIRGYVRGFRPPKAAEPWLLGVDVSVWNDAAGLVLLDLPALRVTAEDGSAFGLHATVPAEPLAVEYGEKGYWEVLFALPPGSGPDAYPVESLRLHWSLDLDGFPVGGTIDYERAEGRHIDPDQGR